MRFLQFVIRPAGVRCVLEIGAFIDLWTVYFAKAVPADVEAVSNGGIIKTGLPDASAARNDQIHRQCLAR